MLGLEPDFVRHVLTAPELLVLGASFASFEQLALWFLSLGFLGFLFGLSSLNK